MSKTTKNNYASTAAPSISLRSILEQQHREVVLPFQGAADEESCESSILEDVFEDDDDERDYSSSSSTDDPETLQVVHQGQGQTYMQSSFEDSESDLDSFCKTTKKPAAIQPTVSLREMLDQQRLWSRRKSQSTKDGEISESSIEDSSIDECNVESGSCPGTKNWAGSTFQNSHIPGNDDVLLALGNMDASSSAEDEQADVVNLLPSGSRCESSSRRKIGNTQEPEHVQAKRSSSLSLRELLEQQQRQGHLGTCGRDKSHGSDNSMTTKTTWALSASTLSSSSFLSTSSTPRGILGVPEDPEIVAILIQPDNALSPVRPSSMEPTVLAKQRQRQREQHQHRNTQRRQSYPASTIAARSVSTRRARKKRGLPKCRWESAASTETTPGRYETSITPLMTEMMLSAVPFSDVSVSLNSRRPVLQQSRSRSSSPRGGGSFSRSLSPQIRTRDSAISRRSTNRAVLLPPIRRGSDVLASADNVAEEVKVPTLQHQQLNTVTRIRAAGANRTEKSNSTATALPLKRPERKMSGQMLGDLLNELTFTGDDEDEGEEEDDNGGSSNCGSTGHKQKLSSNKKYSGEVTVATL